MDALAALAQTPAVRDGSNRARAACEQLRWHEALRRRTAEVAAEGRVQGAQASAALEGADLPVAVVRQLSVGTVEVTDAVGHLVTAALQVTAQADYVSARHQQIVATAPAQALTMMHTAAAAGRHDAETVGRPRRADEPVSDGTVTLPPPPTGAEFEHRLAALGDLLTAPTSTPALLVAALVWGELTALQVFAHSNALVARAMLRVVMVGRGLDPLGVCVPEAAVLADPALYARRLNGYCSGTLDGVADWVGYCADVVVSGCAVGSAVADGVLAGRFPQRQ